MAGFKRFDIDTGGFGKPQKPVDDGADFAPMGGIKPPKDDGFGGLSPKVPTDIDMTGEKGLSLAGAEGAVAAREQNYPYKYGFVSGPMGMSYALQGLGREDWGNPGWQSGKQGLGYADPKYYLDPMYRPMFDFTAQGGGVMPNDPFKKITS